MDNLVYFMTYEKGKYKHFFSTSYQQPNVPDNWVPVSHRLPNNYYKNKQEVVTRLLSESEEVPNPNPEYQP